MRYILVPHPYGRLRQPPGPRLRASKIAMHMDVPVTRSAWMHESGLRAILSNWVFSSCPTRPSIKKAPLCGVFFMDGAPGEIRTPDRSVRSRVLYPAELQALNLETRFYG